MVRFSFSDIYVFKIITNSFKAASNGKSSDVDIRYLFKLCKHLNGSNSIENLANVTINTVKTHYLRFLQRLFLIIGIMMNVSLKNDTTKY